MSSYLLGAIRLSSRRSLARLHSQARPRAARRDAGDSLIEVLLTVVIIGLTVGALLAALASTGNAGNTQRSSVQSDLLMRNFADAAKIAAQHCLPNGPLIVDIDEPTGYVAAITSPSATPPCPSTTAATVLTLLVTGPLGVRETMQIAVRRP